MESITRFIASAQKVSNGLSEILAAAGTLAARSWLETAAHPPAATHSSYTSHPVGAMGCASGIRKHEASCCAGLGRRQCCDTIEQSYPEMLRATKNTAGNSMTCKHAPEVMRHDC
jgi:hypothetical protein